MADDKDLLTGNVFPKEFVEGAIAECIAQIKYSLDVVTNNIKGVKKIDSVKGSFLISASEASGLIKMLEHYSDASLSPKHRLSRYVLKSFVKKLKGIDGIMDAKRMDKKEIVEFAKIVTSFLVALHTVMLEDTREEVRYASAADFCGDDLEGLGARGKVITIH